MQIKFADFQGLFKNMQLKTKIEFENWLLSLEQDNLSEYDKKLLNILYSNLEVIYSKGLRGLETRANFIANKIKTGVGEELDFSLIASQASMGSHDYPFTYIQSLEVESFRGFVDADEFTFSPNINLIYGPNGSGKTSFSEALEYALLGDIEEAGQRGVSIDKYIVNAETNKVIKPRVYYLDATGVKVQIPADPELFRWLFVEKNRINNFARVSAKTPGKQVEIISKLFGLDDFNEFVKNFTQNFVIQKDDTNSKLLESLEIKFEQDKVIVQGEVANLAKQEEAKLVVFEKFNQSAYRVENVANYDGLVSYLNGQTGSQGRIYVLQNQKAGINRIDIVNFDLVHNISNDKDSCLTLIDNYKKLKQQCDSEVNNINLKDLYEAALRIKNLVTDKCPLCLTPTSGFIKKVKVNPYKYAEDQLRLLAEASRLQEQKNVALANVQPKLKELVDKVEKINSFYEQTGFKIELQFEKDKLVTESSIIEIENALKDQNFLSEAVVKDGTEKIINFSTRQQAASASGALITAELDFLVSLFNEINGIDILVTNINDRKAAAQQRIEEFNRQNELAIRAAEAEVQQNLEYENFEKSYLKLLQSLEGYKEQLPLTLMSGLNDKVVEFYNIINCHDAGRGFEQIEKIELPAKAGDIVKIYFKDNPARACDALHVLSEGHVKCLGLAILLAKSVLEDAPVLVLDDLVNAIDDDHRSGIRDLLLINPDINTRQIIITSHGENFITQTVNELNKDENNLVEITFILPDTRGVKSIKDDTRHYLTKAEQFLKSGKNLDCVAQCRFAITSIGNSLWKNLMKKGFDHNITIKKRYNGKIEDYSIITSLNKQYKELSKKGMDYSVITSNLDKLIEPNNWSALNATSHHQDEEEEKVENTTVQLVFNTISELDQSVSKL